MTSVASLNLSENQQCTLLNENIRQPTITKTLDNKQCWGGFGTITPFVFATSGLTNIQVKNKCQQKCLDDPTCNSFQTEHYPLGEGMRNTCQINTGASCNGTSDPRPGRYFYEVTRPMSGQCETECNTNAECKYFTFDGTLNKCSLYSECPIADVIAEEPEVIAEEPEVISQEPKVIAEEPKVIAEEPEVIAQEPKVIAEEPKVINISTMTLEEIGVLTNEYISALTETQLEELKARTDVLTEEAGTEEEPEAGTDVLTKEAGTEEEPEAGTEEEAEVDKAEAVENKRLADIQTSLTISKMTLKEIGVLTDEYKSSLTETQLDELVARTVVVTEEAGAKRKQRIIIITVILAIIGMFMMSISGSKKINM